MRRDIVKLAIVGVLILLAMMYGMELASSGISTVYGPLEESGTRIAQDGQREAEPPDAAAEASEAAAARRAGGARFADEPPGIAYDPGTGPDAVPAIPRLDREPVVDRLAGKTAETLQQLSKSGIRLIVSLFESATE